MTWLLQTSALLLMAVALVDGYTTVSSAPSRVMRTRMSPLFKPTHLQMVGSVFDPESLPPLPQEPLSPAEVWCVMKMEKWYSSALKMKCPWIRRRLLDFVDTVEMIARMTVIRKKSLETIGAPLGLRGDKATQVKVEGLSLEEMKETIRHDWRERSGKGYYITGNLNHMIYRNDCLFDGPDPDMPVKGLRKFRGAASQLFDRKMSSCQLLSINIDGDVVVAKWKMAGALRLPWRPRLPEVVGETVYHFDEDGLIYLHEESWNVSGMEAFLKTGWFKSNKHASEKPIAESVPVS